MDISNPVSRFIGLLVSAGTRPSVFNPWHDYDKENEISSEGPKIRRRQLQHYLEARIKKAKYLLIGEGLSYQGGHFTGMAMTSERILLGQSVDKGISPGDVLPGLKPERTSKPELRPLGFSEPTASIVWPHMLQCGLKGTDFVLWNAFPWHPYQPQKGLLSNRKPSCEEEIRGRPVLEAMLGLFPGVRVIAIGKVSEGCLGTARRECVTVRHPAQGGAGLFRRQIRSLLTP